MAEETKIVKAAPAAVNFTIVEYGFFGWKYISILPDTSNLKPQSSAITENGSVSITFLRDSAMENYGELVRIEKQYLEAKCLYDLNLQGYTVKKNVSSSYLFIIWLFTPLFPVGIFLLFRHISAYYGKKKNLAGYKERLDLYDNTKKELIKQAKHLAYPSDK